MSMSMNKLWKQSGTTLSFKEWLPKYLAQQEAKANSSGPAPVNVDEMFSNTQSGASEDYSGVLSDTGNLAATKNNKPTFHIHHNVWIFGIGFLLISLGIMFINKSKSE